MRPAFIPVGQIVNAHGIRGEVKVNPHGFDPEFLTEFDTIYIDGQPVRVRSARVHKSTVLMALPGVDDMDAALALKGFFPEEEIKRLRHTGAMLQGHPDMKGPPGVDMSTGSLGQGISAAVGMALAGKLDHADYRVYAVLGDGEIEEGQVWEAAMFAAAKKLDNLCIVVDNNNLQIDGTIEEVNSPYPIPEKFEAFGFNVVTIDGHDLDQIDAAFTAARACKGKPTAIIQKTVKGKGVSYMENQVAWHGSAPNQEQRDQAYAELQAVLNGLEEG